MKNRNKHIDKSFQNFRFTLTDMDVDCFKQWETIKCDKNTYFKHIYSLNL